MKLTDRQIMILVGIAVVVFSIILITDLMSTLKLIEIYQECNPAVLCDSSIIINPMC